MYRVYFYHTATEPRMVYQDGFATQTEAQAEADWLTANGFWYDSNNLITSFYQIGVEAY